MENTGHNQTEKYLKISIILFIVGAIFGMLLIGFSVYADFESTLFDLSYVADSALRPINCPVFLGNSENGTFSAVIRNPSSQENELTVRAHISKGHLILMREVEDKITIGPLETQKLSWEVNSSDAAYGHLILAKVIVLGTTEKASHKGSCGIIVLNLPEGLSGWQLYWAAMMISFGGVVSGMVLRWRYGRTLFGRNQDATRSILGLGGIIITGLIFISLGIWELAAAGFYIGLLLIGVSIPHFLLFR